jgi:hypothetical protein
MAFDPDRVQSHLEHLIKQMLAARALKLAQFDEGTEASAQSPMADLDPKRTRTDFKTFVAEFRTQVLGVGKAPAGSHGPYGPGAGAPQPLSHPSNEAANQLLESALGKAVAATCSFTVRQPKQADAAAMKGREVLGQAPHIQLKEAVVESLKAGEQAAGEPSDQDAEVYEYLFGQVRRSTEPRLAEVNAFLALQDGQQPLKKLVCTPTQQAEAGVPDRSPMEATLIALRNLSSLACVYTDRPSSMVRRILEDKAQSVLAWFTQVFLPLCLLKRNEGRDQDGQAAEDDAPTQVWFELDQSLATEKLDKNVCLFLNELTGHGHLYGDEAKAQREEIRSQLLVSCLDSLREHVGAAKGLEELTVLEQARLASNLLTIQHLSNQYN